METGLTLIHKANDTLIYSIFVSFYLISVSNYNKTLFYLYLFYG